MDKDTAIAEAVKACVKRGILVYFLEKHGSEVLNMFNEEWNLETAIEVAKEEGVEIGMEKGIEEGETKALFRTAREMKARNMNVNLIAEITGLSVAEIEKL